VERPAIRDDKPMKLKVRMNITVHPITATNRIWAWLCDNYLITDSGVSECLHKTLRKFFRYKGFHKGGAYAIYNERNGKETESNIPAFRK
jgi:hypothetical protein